MNPGDELVDVINEAGRVVATVTRREMRAQRLPHRCTYVLVFNRHGELFVHLRTATKDVYPSHWDVTIGGVLAAGETFDEGVVRETREELGVEGDLTRLFPFDYEDALTRVAGMVYRLNHEGPFQLQPEEIVRGEFVPVDRIAEMAMCEPYCPDGLAILKAYRERAAHF